MAAALGTNYPGWTDRADALQHEDASNHAGARRTSESSYTRNIQGVESCNEASVSDKQWRITVSSQAAKVAFTHTTHTHMYCSPAGIGAEWRTNTPEAGTGQPPRVRV